MNSLLILINTYKRRASLRKLVRQLLIQLPEADIVIYNDDPDNAVHFQESNIDVINYKINHGKKLYWQIWNDEFTYCKKHTHDYYLFLPDDVELCPNFFKRMLDIFNSEDGCVCLSPLMDSQTVGMPFSRWGVQRIETKPNIIISQFFDCIGLVNEIFLRLLEYKLDPVDATRWAGHPERSSGVGQQITTRLQNYMVKMCHVRKSLVSTGIESSVMNADERSVHPMLVDWRGYDNSVDVYMASLWRDGHVINTALSILKQPECATLNISCNNYTYEQFECVKSQLCEYDNVYLHRTNNEKGSNEKLRYVTTGQSKYIAFVDDDLVYNDLHLYRLILKCEAYNGAVTLHGSKLLYFPIKSYYNGRYVYSWRSNIFKDYVVDVIGTGCSLMKREFFTPDEWSEMYDTSPEVSMDDIIVSRWLHQNGIPTYVVVHSRNSMTHKQVKDSDNYVFNQYHNNDIAQISYINHYWRPWKKKGFNPFNL